jgi:hypothetical protein
VKNRFRVGDKVRLMDEATACEVSGILSEKLVKVRDENGFEYTVNVNKIVPLFSTQKITTEEQMENPVEISLQTKFESLLQYFGNTPSLFLCVTPENFDSLLNTSYKIYLVNSSQQTILYSLRQINAEEASYGILNTGEEIWTGTSFPTKKPPGILLQLKCIIHSDESKITERQLSLSPEDFTNDRLFHSAELFKKHILSFDCLAQSEVKIPDSDITKLVDHFSTQEKKVPVKENPATETGRAVPCCSQTKKLLTCMLRS